MYNIFLFQYIFLEQRLLVGNMSATAHATLIEY